MSLRKISFVQMGKSGKQFRIGFKYEDDDQPYCGVGILRFDDKTGNEKLELDEISKAFNERVITEVNVDKCIHGKLVVGDECEKCNETDDAL